MLTFIAFLAFIAWLWLALFRGGFWRADQRLGDTPSPARWPGVAALIPARNEADTIGGVVAALSNADYPGDLQIVVVDDGSSDGTADLARAAASRRAIDIVAAPPLPPGWTGKLWALQTGLDSLRSRARQTDYVLFLDADISLAPDTLSRLVAKAEHENLSLASLMSRLDSRGPWASFLIPAFIFFFQKLYPFARANNPDDNMAAAAGGCMLARWEAIATAGAMESIRGALIDDCAFARAIKNISPSTRIWLGLARDEAVSLRDNRELASIWNMVARTAFTQLGYSPVLLAATVLGMALIYLAAPLIVLTLFSHGNVAALFYAVLALSIMGYIYWPTLRLYDRAPWEAALLPAAGALYTAMTISSALRHWRGQGGQWKGRTY